MTQLPKRILNRALRLICTPLRLIRRGHRPSSTPAAHMEIPNAILLSAVRDALRQGHTATIAVKGRSMRPFLEHLRDKVLLTGPSGARTGDAVLAEIAPGTFVLHRIMDVQPHATDQDLDAITLMGDGNIAEKEHCTRRDLCGIVDRYIYPHRTVSAYDPALRRSIRWWRRLLPIRRYLLAIYRATT